MYFLQVHLPQEEDATEAQEWGFTLWEFIAGNWLYLLGIVLVLIIFLYARHRRKKKFKK